MFISVIQIIQFIHNFSKVVLTETKNYNNAFIFIWTNFFGVIW